MDNLKVGQNFDLAVKVAQYSDGAYRPCDPKRIYVKPEKTFEICNRLILEDKYEILNDYDNHLDNIKLDWLNPSLNEEIEGLL